jgi:hypothetical protein
MLQWFACLYISMCIYYYSYLIVEMSDQQQILNVFFFPTCKQGINYLIKQVFYDRTASQHTYC